MLEDKKVTWFLHDRENVDLKGEESIKLSPAEALETLNVLMEKTMELDEMYQNVYSRIKFSELYGVIVDNQTNIKELEKIRNYLSTLVQPETEIKKKKK